MDEKKKKNQDEKTELSPENELAQSVKAIFEENSKLKTLLVTSDGQAFYESNKLYAERHQRLKKLKLYKINSDLSVELLQEPD
ncbi:hypothetical protein [Raineya sp.]